MSVCVCACVLLPSAVNTLPQSVCAALVVNYSHEIPQTGQLGRQNLPY